MRAGGGGVVELLEVMEEFAAGGTGAGQGSRAAGRVIEDQALFQSLERGKGLAPGPSRSARLRAAHHQPSGPQPVLPAQRRSLDRPAPPDFLLFFRQIACPA